MESIFNFKSLAKHCEYLALDKSEIRSLPEFDEGGLCHCTLASGKTSRAVKHQTVREIWYFLSGKGEIWQDRQSIHETKPFKSGDSFTIPLGNSFQFRNTGKENLTILIVTIPKGPVANEANQKKLISSTYRENT